MNSDDPAYFGGYVNQNFVELFAARRARGPPCLPARLNSFEASFADAAQKKASGTWAQGLLERLREQGLRPPGAGATMTGYAGPAGPSQSLGCPPWICLRSRPPCWPWRPPWPARPGRRPQDRRGRGLVGRCGRQYGAAIRNGFQLAAEQINAAGGINGNKIQLVIEDEQGKKEEAINAFKKLVFQDKVLMLFGPTLSNSAQASNPIAQAVQDGGVRHLEHRRRHHLDRRPRVPQLGDRGRRAARDAQDGDQEGQRQEGRRALRQRRCLHQERLRQLQEGAGRPEACRSRAPRPSPRAMSTSRPS